MQTFLEFEQEPKQNWLKGVVALSCLQDVLEPFIDEEIGIFHQKLLDECGTNLCEKKCNLNTWKPHPNQSPPFDCDVCSSWRDAILANHTSPRGKVMWVNSKPDQWSQDKWEVAKVYMPGGHKNHHSIGDFDIAALLCLIRQCKHFNKFKLLGLSDNVANVRTNIMHSPSFKLEQNDLLNYLNQIRKLGEVLEKHFPDFKNLSKDINEIQSLKCRLILPDNITAQKSWAKDEKQLEDILFAVAREAAEHDITRLKLESLEKQLAQLEQENSPLNDYYDLYHKPRGLCVVINNEDFLGTGLSNRRGTQEDEKALHTVFTRLGFTVLVHNNLTAEAMRQTLKELGSQSFLDADVLVVCVLSQGKRGCVFGTDEKKVYLQDLRQPFTSSRAPTLAGKPKLFFIQACTPMSRQEEVVRESALENDATCVQSEDEHYDPDFLLGMVTMLQCKSFYIPVLCTHLMRSAKRLKKDDILSVLTRVNREVSEEQYLQITELKTTLTKKLVLKYVHDDLNQV